MIYLTEEIQIVVWMLYCTAQIPFSGQGTDSTAAANADYITLDQFPHLALLSTTDSHLPKSYSLLEDSPQPMIVW